MRGELHAPAGSICPLHSHMHMSWTDQVMMHASCMSQDGVMMSRAKDIACVILLFRPVRGDERKKETY